MTIVYRLEPGLSGVEFAQALHASGLASRRPSEVPRLEAMLRGAQIIVTARDNSKREFPCTFRD